MSISYGFAVPHPPLLVPAVGRESLRDVTATTEALKSLATVVAARAPRALVFISPHSPITPGAFTIRGAERLRGSFAGFGCPDEKFTISNDLNMVDLIRNDCDALALPMATIAGGEDPELDWGVLVPYSYFGCRLPIVSLSISSLPLRAHFDLGAAVARAAASTEDDFIFVASGDLSHRLTPNAPYGFSPDGAPFDRAVTELLASGSLDALLDLDDERSISAGECGLRSFAALAGALAGSAIEPRLLSYEGPFGVGYAVASFEKRGNLNV